MEPIEVGQKLQAVENPKEHGLVLKIEGEHALVQWYGADASWVHLSDITPREQVHWARGGGEHWQQD